ncbi:MAG: sensor histidine kinase [Gemmatimonadaceae bacterium]
MTTSSEGRPLAGDGAFGASPGWRAQLPFVAFAFVVACLFTLAVTPIVMIRRLDGLRRVANGTVGAARPISGDLRLLFVEESDDQEDYLLERDTVALTRYRRRRIEDEKLFARLDTLARVIGAPVEADVDELARRAARWHALTDAQVDDRVSARAFTASLPRVTAGRDSVLAASEALRAALNRAYDDDTAKGTAILDDQRVVSATLGVLAVLTTLVIAWFAHRERALGRELARAVAEEARLRGESERRREEMERLTAEKSRLIRGFTHDVKNPIGAADGYLQLLAEGLMGPLDEKQRVSIDRAHRSLASALNLIGDLLEISRTDADSLVVAQVPTDVCEIAIDAVDEWRARAEAKGLRLAVDCRDDIPLITSDPARVRQVVGNLISNAVKYTPRGSVVVRVRMAEARGSRTIHVEVTDTGPGIPRERMHLLFREFVRLDPAAGPGVGIGLAISQRIATALGGTIEVSSEVGRGTTFTLTLPAGERSTATREEEERSSSVAPFVVPR